ncbi:MAG: HAMP domain-containing histidine kinase, partial [Thiovulaceae bacterium]|nr:HAMP domain-containing histidine kinase [Sulfurimonadaceae bacterium]
LNRLGKDEIDEKLKSITKRMEYMSDTIEDFINYYKPDKEKTMFNISQALDKALGIVDFLTKKKDTDVKINLSVDNSLETYGLMNEYVQVIVTILSNIRDIIVEKMIDNLHIDISLYKDSDFNVLSISDNCGGISKNNLSKIFDPYFTTKHQSIGTGLGLYIAKMIIEDNMGGELSAQNNQNGALFTIKTR